MLTEDKDKCLSSNPNLKYDEACLDILNNWHKNVTIFGQYAECEGCDYQNYTTLSIQSNTSLLINTKYSMRMEYLINDSFTCKWEKELFEHYRYGWNISDACGQLYIKQPADNAYLPILSAFIILFIFGTMWYMVKCIYKCSKNSTLLTRVMYWKNEVHDDLGNVDTSSLIIESRPKIRKHPHRIKSLDVFRGLCIILMIFVNYGGGQYWFFKHSVWNGLTIADLIFPWFMWVMGFSISVSLKSKLRRAVPRRQLIFQIIRRSIILIFLGFMLNSHGRVESLATIRYPGVLQRIGVTYLIVGILEASLANRVANTSENRYKAVVQDILESLIQWAFIIVLLVLHICITFYLEVPGCGKGYLGPGGLHDGGKHFNCTGGAAGYIDRQVFGKHMYTHPTCHKIYETKLFYDPEGILGTFTCCFLVYLGVQAGRILYTYTNVKSKVIRWITWGMICGLLGGLLCNFSKNDGLIPLNKNLWSLSFVLTLGGFAFLIHSLLFVIVDITRKWGGRPFFYPGMNAIVLYVGHELFKNTFPFAWTPVNRTHASYLAMNLWGTALWVSISILMYKRNVFLSL